MKKCFITMVSLLLTLISNAQITLNYFTNAPSPWDYYECTQVQKMINVGSSGANQHWNFSTIDTTESRLVRNAAFASQDMLTDVTLNDSLGKHLPYKIYQDSVLLHKNAIDLNENPLTYLTFPFTYGDEVNDEGHYIKNEFYGQYNVTTKRNIKADGWGTITLPDQSTHNVIRVVTSDSIFENYCGQGGCFSQVKFQQNFAWFNANQKYPIFQYTTENVIGDPYTSYDFRFMSNLPSTVSTEDINLKLFDFYPNPSKQQINVINAVGNYTISNINGQTVLSGKIDNSYRNINISNLANGLYFLSIFNEEENSIQTQKFIKN
jgi:hypothetical protein